jgi:hypothetical protein
MDEMANHWAVMLPNKSQPYVMKEDISQKSSMKRQINSFIVICTSEALFAPNPEFIAGKEEKNSLVTYHPDEIQENWNQSEQEGKEVDPAIWAKLSLTANQVLVKATLLSRLRGAGEEAN